MAKLTKRLKAQADKVEVQKHYGVAEAIGLVKSLATSKFDETVEVAINLGVDPRTIFRYLEREPDARHVIARRPGEDGAGAYAVHADAPRGQIETPSKPTKCDGPTRMTAS